MNPGGPLRRYRGQHTYRVVLSGIEREMPLVQIDPGVYIASDAGLILGDVEFLTKAARLLARKIKRFNIEIVLTAEAKSIALAYEVAKRLGNSKFIVARKSIKRYMDGYFEQRLRSITTESEQRLLLTKEELELLSGRRVCLLDDVVSTGATFKALEAMARKAGANVVCRAAIWREGPWHSGKGLLSAGVLPVFITEDSPLAKRLPNASR